MSSYFSFLLNIFILALLKTLNIGKIRLYEGVEM